MLAIGVGCFWFTAAFKRRSLIPYTIAQHFDDLRAALESLDNVSDVDIQRPSVYPISNEIDLSQDNAGVSDEPLAIDGSIKFEIYLPIRVQKHYGFDRSLYVDRFRVLVTYQYYSPLTLVYFDAPDDEELDELNPSTAVVIVRRFLEEKFSNHASIRFNSLGPSPFHADFFLRASAAKKEPEAIRIPQRGYDTVIVESIYEDGTPTPFLDEYEDVLSAFYALTRRINKMFESESEILDLVQSLVTIKNIGSPLWKMWLAGVRRSAISAVYEAILKDRMLKIAFERLLMELKRSRAIEAGNVLQIYIEGAAADVPTLPIHEIQKVVDIIEGRRQKLLDNGSTLVAGVVGAVLGAALTILVPMLQLNKAGGPPSVARTAPTSVPSGHGGQVGTKSP